MIALPIAEDVLTGMMSVVGHYGCPIFASFRFSISISSPELRGPGKVPDKLWKNESIINPHFVTYTVQNVDDLAYARGEILGAIAGLNRRVYIKSRRFRALETTVCEGDVRRNAIAHKLLDCEVIADAPQTDIAWRPDIGVGY